MACRSEVACETTMAAEEAATAAAASAAALLVPELVEGRSRSEDRLKKCTLGRAKVGKK